MQIGTTKDQGLYNKPSAAVHPGALAAGTLPQYDTIPIIIPRTFAFTYATIKIRRCERALSGFDALVNNNESFGSLSHG